MNQAPEFPPVVTAPVVPEVIGVMPETFEPGIYVAKAPLPSEAEEMRVIGAYESAAATAPRDRAIGMAALPAESRGEQLSSLVYNGMTSAEYAERHNAWLADFTARERMQRAVEDDERASDKKKVGANR